MKTIFNFTDREDKISKSGTNPEILIRVTEQDTNTVYTPEINIKKKFPPESKIYIQPYSIEGYVGDPVDFGTIQEPEIKSVINADVSPDQVKFRLKVIENTENSIKKVLGTCYDIKPWQPANISLLDIGESKIDSIFQIEVVENEKPRIIFKTGLGLKTDISRSSWLKGIFFTAALREILLKYIIEEDQFSECKIKKKFIEHFENITGEDFPKNYEPGKEGTAKWINSAIAEFSNNHVKKGISLISIMPDNEIELKDKALFTRSNNR